MRKFKHIISQKVVEQTNSKYHYVNNHELIPNWIVENSNDWIELKEDEYPKIVSFKVSRHPGLIFKLDHPQSTEYNWYCHKNTWLSATAPDNIIYQVAVDKNTIFTVGDRVTHRNRQVINPWKETYIEKFSYQSDKIFCHVKQGGCTDSCPIENLAKLSSPILTTFDNKEVYEGETFYNLSTTEWTYSILTAWPCYKNCAYTENKLFASKEKMLEYIDENKPKFSKAQIKEALNVTEHLRYIQEIKKKLGI